MREHDTTTTLIALILASALMIYLGGWLGAGGVAIFLIYAWFSPAGKRKNLLGQAAEGAETGCGIIVLIVVVLMLARMFGCR